MNDDRVPRVTVLTPSIRSRRRLLVEARASVAAQTVPARHLVAIDRFHRGPARTRNRLLRRVTTEWVAFLDDDDLLDPEHLEVLLAAAERTGADVVASLWRWERLGGTRPVEPVVYKSFDAAALRALNYIAITALARTDAVRRAGDFRADERHEDWGLWLRMLDAGARFELLPEVTWTCRIVPKSWITKVTWRERWRWHVLRHRS